MTGRRLHEAASSVEIYSPAEERFNRRRRTAGLFLGPVLFAAILALPLRIPGPPHRLAAIAAMMIVLWVTEALPLAVTALIGPVLAAALQVAPAQAAFAPFADPIIFMFIGSFMLAEAMFVHGLDRRIAFTALSWRAVGASPGRILVVYGAVAAAISMWISNTATTAMMFPIGLSIVAHVTRGRESRPGSREFATAMMLMAAFGASVGGLGTPIGTPPNLIGIGMLSRISGVEISFFRWMLIGVPLVGILFGFLIVLFHYGGLRRPTLPRADIAHFAAERRRLGPLSPAQRNVLVASAVTVALWVLPGVLGVFGARGVRAGRELAAAVPESVAAMTGAMLLFVLPVRWRARRFTLTWEEAVRIDWGLILLFGGGLAMGELAFSTGLADLAGQLVTGWLPARSPVALTAIFSGLAILMSEVASNTASANMVVPIAIAVSQAAGVSPLEPALGATLGASMGFMMPISTPPNALVYSSGYVPITAMVRYGLALDVAGFAAINVLVHAVGWML